MTFGASPLRAFHASNALTYGSLLAGVGAIAAAIDGNRAAAGALIALSVILDTFDGRFAGMFPRTPGQRAIGVQLDSLSDAIAFGVAPVLCMGLPAWAVFAFAAAVISRLAFYNVTHAKTEGFVGMPAPVAALTCASALLLDPGQAASIALLLVTAVAMVAPLPFPRPTGIGLAAFVCWPALVLAAHLVRG